MNKPKENKKHEHKWEVTSIMWEHSAAGLAGTVMPIQYAYLLCQCTKVVKKEVENYE